MHCLAGQAKHTASALPPPLHDGDAADDPFAQEEDEDRDIVDDLELDQTWTNSHALDSCLLLESD